MTPAHAGLAPGSTENPAAGVAQRGAGARPRGRAAGTPAASRTVMVVSADMPLRRRLAASLTELRWRVLEAGGGAEAMMLLDTQGMEAMIADTWLPDLEAVEFAAQIRLIYPEIDLLRLDGEPEASSGKRRENGTASPRRNELLHAIREVREGAIESARVGVETTRLRRPEAYRLTNDGSVTDGSVQGRTVRRELGLAARGGCNARSYEALPGLIGGGPAMQELASLVRLVAPRRTTVLIEGQTGTGKEVVARAVHSLSPRAGKPMAVLNCAAIPESLLEAELFGHTRGAFTGAVQSRMGRIEATDGGTLLLDEIGEMPVGMQAKMLRFLESGELQRVGDNAMIHVDVRLIAATHQPLEQRSAEGTFRLDLYHRLAVFPVRVPSLSERMEDIPALAEYFLEQMGQETPRKRLLPEALAKLMEHPWPGNVRELMHVLERAAILAGGNAEIGVDDVRYRLASRG